MLGVLLLACTPAPTGPEAAPPTPTATDSAPRGIQLDPRALLRAPTGASWVRSSADPRSTRPDAPHWYANGDRGHVLREERGRFVLVDEAGPGVLTRLWSANPERGGALRIVVDGAVAVEGDMAALLSGRASVASPLAAVTARGATWRFPIPYRQSLRVEMTENRGKGVYWIAEGVSGPGPWSGPGPIGTAVPERLPIPGQTQSRASTLGPGESLALVGRGAGLVSRLSATFPPDADLWLTLSFDGQPMAAPVRDFFGVGAGEPPYADFYREVSRDGAVWNGTSHLPMPWHEQARFALENRGSTPAAVTLGIDRASPVPTDLFFHLDHREGLVPTRPRRDWILAAWEGPGRVVADTLTIDNPTEAWWGGGDAKYAIDGVWQRGTGTEDYYGRAWCDPTLVQTPFGGQVRNDNAGRAERACDHSRGVTTSTRTRIFDTLDFAESLDFRLGVRHREDVTMRYRSTVLGYRRP